MKDKILRFCAMPLLLAVVCCGHGYAQKTPQQQKERAAGAGESEIVVERASYSLDGSGLAVRAVVNGRDRLTLTDGQAGTVVVPNGRHLVYIEYEGMFGVMERSRAFKVDAAAARIVFHVSFAADMWTTAINLSKYAEYPLDPSNPPKPQTRQALLSAGSIGAALTTAGSSIVKSLPGDSRIALVALNADSGTSALIRGEVSYHLVSSGCHMIVYDGSLEEFRSVRARKVPADTTDRTLTRLGRFRGANVVIAATVTQSGAPANTVTLRALDVKKGSLIATVREEY
ncbi:MAG: hypothetical protein FWB85_10000 [Chitinispirillia bacterium]|nr:hypothetical protein [Chitinispirillia bacterium]MCL2242535.1 hypothetical protein [Chitinispirillia bacterium]